jgi:type I restriction enzyme S subunit
MLPRLRLKADDGSEYPDWEIKEISNSNLYISDGNYGEQYPTSSQMVASGVPFIRANNIKELKLVWGDMRYITPEHHQILTSGHLKYKDILITTRGEIGSIAFVTKEFDGANINAQICLLRVKGDNQIIPEFLLQALSTNQCKKQFKELQTGSALKQLPKSNLGKVKIPIPSTSEQTKIASFLSAVDEKIVQLTKKHELLTKYKKSVMQKIFSQELRFKADDGSDYPDWNLVSLGQISLATTGSSNRVDSTLVGEYTFFDRSEDIRTSDKYLFDAEAIIVAGEGQSFKPKYFIGKFDLHQRAYAVMNFKNCTGKYIFYHMDFFKNYFLSKAVGSTVKSLRLPMFHEMPINLPYIKEQTKIANFLSTIDDKIQNIQAQLESTKQYKQGLLQQMFV